MILGLTALGAGGAWYYYTQNQAREEDVQQKTRELDHAARVQAQKKVDEGKTKVDELKVRKSPFFTIINKD